MRAVTGIKTTLGLMLIFLTACASSGSAVRTEDVIENRDDRLPFALRFPGDSGKIKSREIGSLESRPGKSNSELWKLARYYHLVSVREDSREKAMSWYGVIVSHDGNGASLAKNNMGCLLSDMGRYTESEKLFQQIIRSEGPLITAYYNLFVLYKYSHREDDAVKTLLLMRDRYPESMYASVEMGDIFFEKEDYASAEKYYAEGIRAGDGNPVPLYKMARLKERMEHYAEAEDLYKRCIREFPYFHFAYVDYSGMLLKLNRKEEARSVLNDGVKRMRK